jgi:Domain of unknown function (DUF4307)
VTQTSAVPGGATPGAGPVFPPGRYGRRREPKRRRWVLPLVLVAVVSVTALLALKLFTQYGSPQYSPTVLSLTNVTKTSITVKFRVQKASPAAVCTVDAEARDGSVLGTANVPVPAGTDVTVSYTITTTDRPYIAEVPSCHAAS